MAERGARSAGILLHRGSGAGLEVFLVHLGGPLWARRTEAAWSIPKGLVDAGESDADAARREFREEVGVEAPPVDLRPLGEFRQSSGKVVVAFEAAWSAPLEWVSSTLFEMEWPPRSGRRASFPEVDAGDWLTLDAARVALVRGQLPLLDALERRLAAG